MRNSKKENYSKIRTLGNLFFNVIFSLLVYKKITDLGSGLNLFSVEKFHNKEVFQMPNDLTFNYHLILYLCSTNMSYYFFPISWREKDQISNMKAFSQINKLLKIIFYFIFMRKNFFKNRIINNIDYKLIFTNIK